MIDGTEKPKIPSQCDTTNFVVKTMSVGFSGGLNMRPPAQQTSVLPSKQTRLLIIV